MNAFNFHSEPLQDAWLDAYGHLNEAYYLVPFSNANWAMQEHFGIGVSYFEKTGCAIYTLETHLRYVNEVRQPADIRVDTIIVDSDPKKSWCGHLMLVNDQVCATAEIIMLHYSTRDNRPTQMPESTLKLLKDAQVESRPDWIGRNISMTKRQ